MELPGPVREMLGMVEYVLADAGSLENARLADQENKERHQIQDLLNIVPLDHSNPPTFRG